MAHPKLAAGVNRSLLAASTVALLAGPLAAAGSAQTVEGVIDSTGQVVEDLTCEQAKATEDELLIEEFCPAEEEDGKDGGKNKGDKGGKEDSSDPVEDVAKNVEQTAKDTVDSIAPGDSDDGGEEEGGEEPAPGGVLPGGGGGGDDGGKGDGGNKPGSRDVGKAGNEDPQPISYSGGTSSSDTSSRAADGAGYSTSGGLSSGLASQSALTLQPFAAPLVSVPPVYEFPQIAEQLFTDDAPATAGDPVAANGAVTPSTEAVNAYNSNGFAATAADPTGWLAATATGLIMLLGAAHALNGGRTPRRAQA